MLIFKSETKPLTKSNSIAPKPRKIMLIENLIKNSFKSIFLLLCGICLISNAQIKAQTEIVINICPGETAILATPSGTCPSCPNTSTILPNNLETTWASSDQSICSDCPTIEVSPTGNTLYTLTVNRSCPAAPSSPPSSPGPFGSTGPQGGSYGSDYCGMGSQQVSCYGYSSSTFVETYSYFVMMSEDCAEATETTNSEDETETTNTEELIETVSNQSSKFDLSPAINILETDKPGLGQVVGRAPSSENSEVTNIYININVNWNNDNKIDFGQEVANGNNNTDVIIEIVSEIVQEIQSSGVSAQINPNPNPNNMVATGIRPSELQSTNSDNNTIGSGLANQNIIEPVINQLIQPSGVSAEINTIDNQSGLTPGGIRPSELLVPNSDNNTVGSLMVDPNLIEPLLPTTSIPTAKIQPIIESPEPVDGNPLGLTPLEDNDKNGTYQENNVKKTDLSFIPEKTATLEFNVYPNPSRGQLNIGLLESEEDQIINIYSATGNLMKTEFVSSNTAKSNVSVDLSDLANGMYMVELNNGSSKTTKTLMVQR